jgi:uncharacterized membrane protein
MTEIGPVQLLAIGFEPDAKFEGRIMGELAKLEQDQTVRILDLLFVAKDADSSDLLALDYQGEDLGAIIGAILGFEFDGGEGASTSTEDQAHAFGLSQDEVQGMAASLAPGQSAAFLLIEHVWARDLKRAVRDAGGVPLGEGFLTPETAAVVGAELLGMAEALDEVAGAEAGAGASA